MQRLTWQSTLSNFMSTKRAENLLQELVYGIELEERSGLVICVWLINKFKTEQCKKKKKRRGKNGKLHQTDRCVVIVGLLGQSGITKIASTLNFTLTDQSLISHNWCQHFSSASSVKRYFNLLKLYISL